MEEPRMRENVGSIVIRRRLGAILRKMREDLGLSVRSVGERGDISAGQVSKIENGRIAIRAKDVRELCRVYVLRLGELNKERGPDDQLVLEGLAGGVERLAELANGTSQKSWWEASYGKDAVPEELQTFYELEQIAISLRLFDPVLVPGLLQTEAYARAIYSVTPGAPGEVVEKRIKFRMERTARLQDRGAELIAVLGAGALALQVGSSDVMAAQVQHLRHLDSQRVAKIWVLPWTVGAYPMLGTYTLMTFRTKEDPATAYIAIPGGARYEDRPEEVAEYERQFQSLAEKSIPIGDYTP
jgi:transcriptional regulator with XRE-family HTH domain